MLVYLTPEDYFISNLDELCTKIPGFSFIFYISENCKYCKDIYPYFTQLSQSIQGCVFGLMNVDQSNQKIVEMASFSKTKIKYVPYLLIYYEGKPIAEFHPNEKNPQENAKLMRDFLIKTTTDVNKFNKPQQVQSQNQNTNNKISEYSIGVPGNKKRVCYFNYENAYPAKTE